MRRSELIDGFEETLNLLQRFDLIKLLQTYARRERGVKEPQKFLVTFSELSNHAARLSPSANQIMETFAINTISHPAVWESFLRPQEEARIGAVVNELYISLVRFHDAAPKIMQLLKRQSDTREVTIEELSTKNKPKAQKVKAQKLTLYIREPAAPNLTVEQFSNILTHTRNIYEAVLRIENAEHAELIVGSLDSGSDKSLDIIGAANAIGKLSSLLLEIWDRIRFARTTKTSASIKAATESVSLLSEIGACVGKGSITAEEGEKLKRVVIKAFEELFAGGVYTREMETEVVALKASALPIERRKLITHYVDRGTKETKTPPQEVDEISNEDLDGRSLNEKD